MTRPRITPENITRWTREHSGKIATTVTLVILGATVAIANAEPSLAAPPTPRATSDTFATMTRVFAEMTRAARTTTPMPILETVTSAPSFKPLGEVLQEACLALSGMAALFGGAVLWASRNMSPHKETDGTSSPLPSFEPKVRKDYSPEERVMIFAYFLLDPAVEAERAKRYIAACAKRGITPTKDGFCLVRKQQLIAAIDMSEAITKAEEELAQVKETLLTHDTTITGLEHQAAAQARATQAHGWAIGELFRAFREHDHRPAPAGTRLLSSGDEEEPISGTCRVLGDD